MSDAHAAIGAAIEDHDYERADDIRDAMRRPAHVGDYDRPCVRCGIRRSIHVRPDGFGGENGYLKIAKDDVRAYAHMRGTMCLYRR